MKDFRELAIQLCCVCMLYMHNHPEERLDNLKIDMNMIKELYERLVYDNKENLVNDEDFLRACMGYENKCYDIVSQIDKNE